LIPTSEDPSPFDPAPGAPADPTSASTARLLERVRSGDGRARELILARYLPALRRWAHGRLPRAGRDLLDTDDLVQNTLIRALSHLDDFESRFAGAFFAYLRRAIVNQIRDQVRRARRTPERAELAADMASYEATPIEQVIGSDVLEHFERALEKLTPAQREAVLMNVDLGFRYRQIAEVLGLSSDDAARKLVARALVKLADEMGDLDVR